MLPTLQIFSLSLNIPGLLILISLWVGLSQSERLAPRFGFTPSQVSNLALFILAGGLLGARLAYAMRYTDAFLSNPLSLLSPNPLMLDLSGGVVAAVLTGLIFMQRKKMSVLEGLDTLTPLLILFSIGLGFSHLASGEAYGAPTALPWGLNLWGEYRHPTQIFEILLAVIGACILWPKNDKINMEFIETPGVRFLSIFVLAAFSRLMIEPFRGDVTLFAGILRFPQILAFGLMIVALTLIARLLKKSADESASIKEG